jgi:putative colanic acid biosynthesis UDP-glucose lipid carrier transferase
MPPLSVADTAPAAPAAQVPPPQSPLRMFDGGGRRRRLFDAAPLPVSGFVAAVLEPSLTVGVLVGLHAWHDEPFTRAAMALSLLVVALSFPGRDRFRDRPLTAAVDIAASWLVLALVLLLCGYATSSLHYFEWAVIGPWLLLAPLAHWAAMMAGRDLMRWRARRPGAAQTAIVVGAGALGAKVASALRSRSDRAVEVLGFFDDRSGERVHADARPRRLGALADVAGYVNQRGVAEVYITLPLGSQPRILTLLGSLQGTTASLFFVPDVFGISIIQGRLQDVNGMPVVGICETPFTGVHQVVKRLSDMVLASAILLLLAPLMLLIAAGVKLSSPGPVIFRQRRNGLGGEEIVVYKFRSMRVMDDGAVVRQATAADARITRFGAFLRRSSLDELPQFINVLQGRMSIVGPRPHAVAHNQQYRQLIQGYMVRHKVRPGITGWAQVNGLRGETDTLDKMRARVEYDLEYLRNWSLALDLQIIARTLKLVIADRHAY